MRPLLPAFLATFLLACATPAQTVDIPAASLAESATLLPSATDPAIRTFDHPHRVFVNRDIVVGHKPGLPADRHQLYLFLPGTRPAGKAVGKGPTAFCALAADLGYHVAILEYPNDVPASVCAKDADPKAFEDFRMAIIHGGRSKHLDVEAAESIENRLLKLLLHLRKTRPDEDWGQFLDAAGGIKWEAIAVAGHSQGGGHAALIGIKHKVARVVCTGSPKDYSHRLGAPAAFYKEESATPKNRFFAFNHVQDIAGATTQAQLLENLKALGLDKFGQPVDVDTAAFPYGHARILTTAWPAVDAPDPKSDGARVAHAAPIASADAKRRKQVWTYLLAEPVE